MGGSSKRSRGQISYTSRWQPDLNSNHAFISNFHLCQCITIAFRFVKKKHATQITWIQSLSDKKLRTTKFAIICECLATDGYTSPARERRPQEAAEALWSRFPFEKFGDSTNNWNVRHICLSLKLSQYLACASIILACLWDNCYWHSRNGFHRNKTDACELTTQQVMSNSTLQDIQVSLFASRTLNLAGRILGMDNEP